MYWLCRLIAVSVSVVVVVVVVVEWMVVNQMQRGGCQSIYDFREMRLRVE